MTRLRVITDPETALGFLLAGADVIPVADSAEGARQLVSLYQTKEAGIVITNEEFLSVLPEPTRRALEESLSPIIFAIPVSQGKPIAEPREEYLARLIRRTIGYHLKIKR